MSGERGIINVSAAEEKQLVSTADVGCGWLAECGGGGFGSVMADIPSNIVDLLYLIPYHFAADGRSQIPSVSWRDNTLEQ